MNRDRTFLPVAGIVSMAVFVLSGCVTAQGDFMPPGFAQSWKNAITPSSKVMRGERGTVLEKWWTFLGDPVLNDLVDRALEDNLDGRSALARVRESRSARKSEIQGSDQKPAASFYEAGFDASYEADILANKQAVLTKNDPEAETDDLSFASAELTLIAEIARSYVAYRLFRKQAQDAEQRAKAGKKVLDLIRAQKLYGAATDADVLRAESQVNVARESMSDFLRRADNVRLRLGLLTGDLPEDIYALVTDSDATLGADVNPILASPAQILGQRPDIRVARRDFLKATQYDEFVTANLFPKVALSRFLGIEDNVFIDSENVWGVVPGTAVTMVDFDRVEKRVDVAHAQEEQAYQRFKLSVMEAVMDVEGAFANYARLRKKRISENDKLDQARQDLDNVRRQYQDGKASFLDVMDAQSSVDQAEGDVLVIEYTQIAALIGLYKSVGVY